MTETEWTDGYVIGVVDESHIAQLVKQGQSGMAADARPDYVSEKAKHRQRSEMGTLRSGNHYLEVQAVAEIFEAQVARSFGLALQEVVVTIHCGSRGLGHQIGTEFLKEMAVAAGAAAIALLDRELACAPIRSELGKRYLGAMRATINCALANREILGHFARRVVNHFFPKASIDLLFDVSHNTCKVEPHLVDGKKRQPFVHRKGATRVFGPRRYRAERDQSLLLRLPRRRTRAVAPYRAQAVERT
jgi:tRNA-splicing ligase RtcB (3'-phosphate/5'-hydroxy nucleic acid ligase)